MVVKKHDQTFRDVHLPIQTLLSVEHGHGVGWSNAGRHLDHTHASQEESVVAPHTPHLLDACLQAW